MTIWTIHRREGESEEAFLRRGRRGQRLIDIALFLFFVLAVAAAVAARGCPEDPGELEQDPASA